MTQEQVVDSHYEYHRRRAFGMHQKDYEYLFDTVAPTPLQRLGVRKAVDCAYSYGRTVLVPVPMDALSIGGYLVWYTDSLVYVYAESHTVAYADEALAGKLHQWGGYLDS